MKFRADEINLTSSFESIQIIRITAQDLLQRLLLGVYIAALFLVEAWIRRVLLPSCFFFLFFPPRALYPILVSLHAKDARLLVSECTVNYPEEKEREKKHLMFQSVKMIGSEWNVLCYWKDDCAKYSRGLFDKFEHIKYIIFRLIKKLCITFFLNNCNWILYFLLKRLSFLESFKRL